MAQRETNGRDNNSMNFIFAYLYYETIHEFSVKPRTSFIQRKWLGLGALLVIIFIKNLFAMYKKTYCTKSSSKLVDRLTFF